MDGRTPGHTDGLDETIMLSTFFISKLGHNKQM